MNTDNEAELTFAEQVDISYLDHLLNNLSGVLYQYPPEEKTVNAVSALRAIRRVADSNGRYTVEYRAPDRIYPKGVGCALYLPRPLRHALFHARYVDIDMVNAHPVFLLHLCDTHNHDAPALREYVNRRDMVLRDLLDRNPSLTRDSAKQLILARITGSNASPPLPTKWWEAFASTIRGLR